VSLIQELRTKHSPLRIKMKSKFPLEHIVKSDTQEVWVICESAITAMGIAAMVKKFYPGYKGKIASREHFEKMKLDTLVV